MDEEELTMEDVNAAMEDEGYPVDEPTDQPAGYEVESGVTYRWSYISGQGERIEIESQSHDEFKRAVKTYRTAFQIGPIVPPEKKGNNNVPAPQAATPNGSDAPMCPIHNVPMTLNQGKFGPFWAHKNPDGTYCSGKPKNTAPRGGGYNRGGYNQSSYNSGNSAF